MLIARRTPGEHLTGNVVQLDRIEKIGGPSWPRPTRWERLARKAKPARAETKKGNAEESPTQASARADHWSDRTSGISTKTKGESHSGASPPRRSCGSPNREPNRRLRLPAPF